MKEAIFSLLVFSLTISGCATTGPRVFPPSASPESAWKLAIGRDGKRFTGILLVRVEDDGLAMVVIDPTGITLIGGRVDNSGRVTVNDGLARVRKSGLGPFVGRALYRIFIASGRKAREGCLKGMGLLRYYETCRKPGTILLDNPWPEPDLRLSAVK